MITTLVCSSSAEVRTGASGLLARSSVAQLRNEADGPAVAVPAQRPHVPVTFPRHRRPPNSRRRCRYLGHTHRKVVAWSRGSRFRPPPKGSPVTEPQVSGGRGIRTYEEREPLERLSRTLTARSSHGRKCEKACQGRYGHPRPSAEVHLRATVNGTRMARPGERACAPHRPVTGHRPGPSQANKPRMSSAVSAPPVIASSSTTRANRSRLRCCSATTFSSIVPVATSR